MRVRHPLQVLHSILHSGSDDSGMDALDSHDEVRSKHVAIMVMVAA